MSLGNSLIIKPSATCHLLPCKRWPFSGQKTAFCKPKDRLLQIIRYAA